MKGLYMACMLRLGSSINSFVASAVKNVHVVKFGCVC